MNSPFLKFLLFVVLYLSSNLCICQILKTYSGPYEVRSLLNRYGPHTGNATYQYYEDSNSNRIYQGSFTLSDYQYKVTGNFKNNLKNGLWTYVEKSSYSGEYSKTVTGTYKSGLLQGLWSYKQIELSTNKILKQSSVSFIDGVHIGNFQYSNFNKPKQIENEYNITVKGTYGSTGNNIGKWIIRYYKDGIPFEQIIDCDTKSMPLRNLSNGKTSNEEYSAINHSLGRLHFDYYLSFWDFINDIYWTPENPIFLILPDEGSSFR